MRYWRNSFFFGHHFQKAIKHTKTRKFWNIGLQILIFFFNLIWNNPYNTHLPQTFYTYIHAKITCNIAHKFMSSLGFICAINQLFMLKVCTTTFWIKWSGSPWLLLTSVVPNRGAIYSAQGCRGLARFFTISFKIHFQAVIKPQSKLLWVRHYGCRKLLFYSVGCRKPKKVGKHCLT